MSERALADVVAALRHERQSRKADGVAACGRLARLIVPLQGLLLRSEASAPKDAIGRQYFGLAAAQQELRHRLRVLPDFDARDPIESAVLRVRAASDETYYYLGLAVGLTAYRGAD